MAESKLGGTFLWPADKPWPVCRDSRHVNPATDVNHLIAGVDVQLVPILQLKAKDFPEVEFFPGTDLLQLFWCPLDHGDPLYVAKPYVFWRRTAEVSHPLPETPQSELASDWYLPLQCKLQPERVTEYTLKVLTRDMWDRAEKWCAENLPHQGIESLEEWTSYFYREHTTFPGTKVGGCPHWIQDDETPECTCARRMDYLLTLSDSECDGGNWQRWCPLEDRPAWEQIGLRNPTLPRTREELEIVEGIRDPARFFGLNGGAIYVFICRRCPGWPTASVYQR